MGEHKQTPILVDRYRRLLASKGSWTALESVPEPDALDLSDEAISMRLAATRATLDSVAHAQLSDDPQALTIANDILQAGEQAIRAVREGDEQRLRDAPALVDGLEAIVRIDGSRPTFLIQDGVVDRASSPLTTWGDTLDVSSNLLKDAANCVGRIDRPASQQGFEGTGFLIHENLIVTNRHVLQAIASSEGGGKWTINPTATIDFGHEFNSRPSFNPRKFKRVLFAGPTPIDTSEMTIDHSKLDLAVIELEPGSLQSNILSLDATPDWAAQPRQVFILGFPADPGIMSGYKASLLEKLFQRTFGYKRVAPGMVLTEQTPVAAWTVAHDATTLGGNSGSLVLVIGREQAAAALHYTGLPIVQNWGHIFGKVLDTTDGTSPETLRERLSSFGVQFVDYSAPTPVSPKG